MLLFGTRASAGRLAPRILIANNGEGTSTFFRSSRHARSKETLARRLAERLGEPCKINSSLQRSSFRTICKLALSLGRKRRREMQIQGALQCVLAFVPLFELAGIRPR